MSVRCHSARTAPSEQWSLWNVEWRASFQWKIPNMYATRRINKMVPSPMPAPPP
jgi:hypothetical protein